MPGPSDMASASEFRTLNFPAAQSMDDSREPRGEGFVVHLKPSTGVLNQVHTRVRLSLGLPPRLEFGAQRPRCQPNKHRLWRISSVDTCALNNSVQDDTVSSEELGRRHRRQKHMPGTK